jgi:hypothetical protein
LVTPEGTGSTRTGTDWKRKGERLVVSNAEGEIMANTGRDHAESRTKGARLVRDLRDWATMFERLALSVYLDMPTEQRHAYRAALVRAYDSLTVHVTILDLVDDAVREGLRGERPLDGTDAHRGHSAV